MPYKVTLFIRIRNYTITESHYDVTATTNAQAFANAQQLALLRSAFLGFFANIAAVRFLDVNVPRRAFFLPPGQFVAASGFPDDSTVSIGQQGVLSSDRAYSALMVTLSGNYTGVSPNPTAIKKLYIAGVPDEVIGESDTSGNSGIIRLGVIQAVLTQYFNFLAANYAFRAGYYPASTAAPVQSLVTNPSPPGELGVQFVSTISFLQAPRLHLAGFRAVNPRQRIPQGNYTVDPLSPAIVAPSVLPSVYYLQSSSNILPANVKLRGYGWPQNYQFYKYAAIPLAYQATHRKRGARALAPVGRSRIHY